MIKFEISENTYSRKSSNTYELSILQRMDSFVYMASDGAQAVQFLREYGLESTSGDPERRVEELEALFRSDANLRQPYRNIRIGLVSALHTLIPRRLFNPSQKETYLQQVASLEQGDLELLSDELHGAAIYNIYAYPAAVVRFFREKFPGCRLSHGGSAFLQACRALSSYLEGDQLFLHVGSTYLQVILFQDKHLQFINLYPYQSTKDFIYFVMLVVRQFKLEPEKITAHLSGQVAVDTEIYRTLPRYLRHVELLSPPAYLQIGPALRQAPAHRYYDLFSLVKGI
jgi:hypothetical protein